MVSINNHLFIQAMQYYELKIDLFFFFFLHLQSFSIQNINIFCLSGCYDQILSVKERWYIKIMHNTLESS